MNRSRKISTTLTLSVSFVTLLALSAPTYAAGPDDELEVTMDVVVDDGDHATTPGAELVVREDHDADDVRHERAEHDTVDDDHDGDADRDEKDTDESTEHEEADDSDVNDDGRDGTREHTEEPGG